MASTITAGNATNGLALSCDNTGILELKTGTGAGTTAVTINASQNATFATTVGVGVTPSAWSGTVALELPANGMLSTKGSGTYLLSNAYFDGAFKYSTTAAANAIVIGSNGTTFQYAPSGTVGTAISFANHARIDSSGNVLVISAAGLGYGTGAGGTVTQATNKATAVTLNRPTGQITMNNAALGAGAAASFSVINSLVAASDVVLLTGTNSPDTNNYRIEAFNVAAGGFGIRLINITGGSRSEAVVINFAIIKGATT